MHDSLPLVSNRVIEDALDLLISGGGWCLYCLHADSVYGQTDCHDKDLIFYGQFQSQYKC